MRSRDKCLRSYSGLVASLLCVVDCTVLPAATLVLPLLGAAAPGGLGALATPPALHALGHAVALRVVLPLGGLATLANLAAYRRALPTLGAALGLGLVYAANAERADSQ